MFGITLQVGIDHLTQKVLARTRKTVWRRYIGNIMMQGYMAETLTGDGIRELVRKEAAKVGGIPSWCKENSISDSFLYEVLREMREPSAKLANTLGYRRVIRFEPFE